MRSQSETGGVSPQDSKLKFDFTSTDLAITDVERKKKHDKHLKVIEDQMIQSKQGERALKRQEGDVKKEQRTIRHTVREFETSEL